MTKHRSSEYLRRDLAAIPAYVWALALAVLLLASAACVLWAIYTLRLQQPLPGPSPTPIIWTATPAPTEPSTATPTPAPVPTPTASAGISIGRYVRVTGTEGVGISLRQEPDVNSARIAIGAEGDVLVILDGPRQIGGYTWWLVRHPDDETKQGWGVANYLEPVEHP